MFHQPTTYQTCTVILWTGFKLLLNSSLSNLRALLPSRCSISEKFCVGTCQATGRTTGKCVVDEDGANDCQCSDTFLTGSQFALCAAESTCRLDCQRRQ